MEQDPQQQLAKQKKDTCFHGSDRTQVQERAGMEINADPVKKGHVEGQEKENGMQCDPRRYQPPDTSLSQEL